MCQSERWARWTGVAAVALWVISVFVVQSGDVPAEDASEAAYLAYVDTDGTTILVGGWLFMAGCVAFVWFAIVLRERLAAAEAGSRMFSTVAFIGSILVAAFMMLAPAGEIAAAITVEEQEISPSAVAALRLLGEGLISAATLAATLLMIGSGVVAARTGIFPKAWAWLSILLAAVLLIGPIGWAALLLGLPTWTIATTIFLLRRDASPVPAVTARLASARQPAAVDGEDDAVDVVRG